MGVPENAAAGSRVEEWRPPPASCYVPRGPQRIPHAHPSPHPLESRGVRGEGAADAADLWAGSGVDIEL